MAKLPYNIGSIFTIETWVIPKCNHITTYYLDLLSNLQFAVFMDEHFVMKSKNPNKCIEELKSRGCLCSVNYNYKHLIQ